MPAIATYNGDDLPKHFRYIPYIRKKRISKTPTAKAVIIQRADPETVDGEGSVEFSVEALYPTEYQDLLDKYNAGGYVNFVGYWGETYLVYFEEFRVDGVQGGLFNVSGKFTVICVITPQNAQCIT